MSKKPTARLKSLYDRIGIESIDELMEQAKHAKATGDKMTEYLSAELMTALWDYEATERMADSLLKDIARFVESERQSAENGQNPDPTWITSTGKRYQEAAQRMNVLADGIAKLAYQRKITRGEV